MNRSLKIAAIALGAAALLTYPAILLYRRLSRKTDSGAESTTKSFAPNYRGNHKPHHRKASANGQVQEA